MSETEPLAPVLEGAIAAGDPTALGERLAPGVVLDSNSELGRVLVEGREAVLEHLSRPGPGEVLDWQAQEWPDGLAATFEWRGRTVDRRRWYLRAEEGSVTRIWSYAARTKSAGGEQIPERVLAEVAPGARRRPLVHSGNSGAALERVVLPDGGELIAKRVGPAADWLGRVTGDRGRTALLWEDGAFARMPAELDTGIEIVIADDGGWWVLMRDLSATFLGDERRLSREESRRVLAAGASLHREFASDVPGGAARLSDRLGMSSLRVAELEREGTDLLPKQLEAAWDAFADSVAADVAGEILTAVRDPAPLASALEQAGPLTLIHGDLRDDNLGLTEERVVLLDWDLATAGTPTTEFAWYLVHDAWRIDASRDEVEADFAEAEGDALDAHEHELGMLSGLVQYGWIFGHSNLIHPDPAERAWAREEIAWWEARTRAALERVGGMPRALA